MQASQGLRSLTGFVGAAALCGCAGGAHQAGGTPPAQQVFVTPPPRPPAGPLLAPVQTAGSSASAGGTNFHPLLLTAVTSDFGGDAATTNQGATLAVDASGNRTLTINNPALAVTNVTITGANWAADLADGNRLVVQPSSWSNTAHYDYTQFGLWTVSSSPVIGPRSTAAWAGGAETSAQNVPASGTATYTGDTVGKWSYGWCENACNPPGNVIGKIRLTADFAARSISGAVSDIVLMDDVFFGGQGLPGEVLLTATIEPSSNRFSGTTQGTSQAAAGSFIGPDASGVVSGQFFGPAAEEVGGVWTLTGARSRMIGSFGAHR
jgi:hypothetical protein